MIKSFCEVKDWMNLYYQLRLIWRHSSPVLLFPGTSSYFNIVLAHGDCKVIFSFVLTSMFTNVRTEY